ncbi:bifunctional folylpolyglutamate synthase/dihydrofolate synthase [Guyparkeria hydrothermalis]|uniref:bifunctional folylpolyglutamate synthase/dihydrofolate synthase n=1 Tax=Guyparkeria hydrothermalis TaxID=923 RepID=UPI002020BF09|nr:folylpolyglutamate synthase/dihydrofolate synthase family protein [Guyparkeria hydrothermalis]MCL7743794.1 bifunctional folylpolyglutamate synthase/dihydrofolate synthase [Guyparkeria hydrothermalis]
MSKPVSRWLDELLARDPNRIEPGVERTRRLAHDLLGGKPSACVISVAGTNGKGSSVMMASAICRAAGYRVGSYTSPHLEDVRERFLIDGEQVDEAALVEAFERIDSHPDSDALTYFEWLTLAAFLVFEQAGVDVWVLEVGLGGRLDAVNALDADLALITPIGLDHQAWLGDSREVIGREKAGILRPGQVAVYADPDAVDSVAKIADRLGAELWCFGRDYELRRRGVSPTAEAWELVTRERSSPLPVPALFGRHQCRNAAGVVALLQHPASPLAVPDSAIQAGLSTVRLAGRLERGHDRDRVVWFDVAHNAEAATALAESLASKPVRGRRLAVFSALADKPIEAVVRPMAEVIDAWWVAPLAEPRAADIGRIESALADIGVDAVTREADLFGAYNAALATAGEGDELVVFGSFHVVGPLRGRLTGQEIADV